MGPHPSPDQAQSAARRRANRAHGEVLGRRRTRAVPVIAGMRAKITRRSSERRFFLSPGADDYKQIQNFIGYCLGVAMHKTGTELHAAYFGSNHEHVDVNDKYGVLPDFKRELHSLIARGMNCYRGRSEAFWSPGTGCVTLSGEDLLAHEEPELAARLPPATMNDLVYTLTNPVKDGLVKWGHLWPGFTTYGWRFGETRTFHRPDWFFDTASEALEASVDVTLTRPAGVHPELSDDELFDLLMQQCRARELFFQSEQRRKNRRFKGRSKIFKQSFDKAPTKPEAKFKVKPFIAASSKAVRIGGIVWFQAWRKNYVDARDAFEAGNRDVEFPVGTWKMVRFAGAKLAMAPP